MQKRNSPDIEDHGDNIWTLWLRGSSPREDLRQVGVVRTPAIICQLYNNILKLARYVRYNGILTFNHKINHDSIIIDKNIVYI